MVRIALPRVYWPKHVIIAIANVVIYLFICTLFIGVEPVLFLTYVYKSRLLLTALLARKYYRKYLEYILELKNNNNKNIRN